MEQKFGAVGSAGIFSTVPDILKFLNHILESEFLIKNLTTNAFKNSVNSDNSVNSQPADGQSLRLVSDSDNCAALGFELNNEKFMGKIKEGDAIFGKTGFTGTSFICRPKDRTCLVILSNYTYPKRKPNADRINEFRARLAEEVLL
jgi:CubicO group peptidase (beta-lactamase class C family)